MFKSFDTARDIVNQLSTVNEVVVFGPGAFTGSPGSPGEFNIKKFNHWLSGSTNAESGSYYHAIYSDNYTGSLSVELVDVTFGYSVSSSFYVSRSLAGVYQPATNFQEKNRVYKLFAKQLLGSEESFFTIDGSPRNELIFISLRRSQYKDELKKGTVALQMMASGGARVAGGANSEWDNQVFNDDGAISSFQRGSRGDYGTLKSGSLVGGLVFYQAGILAIIPEVVSNTSSVGTNPGNHWSGSNDYLSMVVSGGIGGNFDNLIDAVRYRLINLSVVNQSNLHSTFYFCRALNDEFNYSSNPTFLDSAGRILPTSGNTDLSTRTYITKVGLMGENSEMLAIASLSRPLKKTPDSELVIKVRLDY